MIGLPLQSPDTRADDRWEALDERVRSEQLGDIDELVSEDLALAEIATLLSDCSASGLIAALALMAEVAALPAYQRKVFARLARTCDQVNAMREARIDARVKELFDAPTPEDDRDPEDCQ